MSVKELWCSQSWLNGSLNMEKGGVTRSPAMMSSIGALCGFQARHSFLPRCVSGWASTCLLLITENNSQSFLYVSEATKKKLVQTIKRKASVLRLYLKNLNLTLNILTQHTFIPTNTLWSAHTHWKIPKLFTSAGYTSPLPLAYFYKVKHSRKEGKNTWSSWLFYSTFPLRSIPLVRVKTNGARSLTGKPRRCITQTLLLIFRRK